MNTEKKEKIRKNRFFSYYNRDIPRGCKLCVKGAKMVLFITGICPRNCYYCPLSDEKKNNDVIYVDEWKTNNFYDAIEECKLIDAKGCGITGGDPLCKLERTINYITGLKKEFGKNFHIHLYTSLNLVDEKSLKKLHDAGLDEIRFHPELDNDAEWDKMRLAEKFEWDVVVEVPAIPGKKEELKDLIRFLSSSKITYINLNELEMSDSNHELFLEKGLRTKSYLSYAITGSVDLGLELIEFNNSLENSRLNIHLCTAETKDRAQMSNRIIRRAKNVKNPFDKVTEEGLLIRGAIYPEKIYDKRMKIKNNNKKEEAEKNREEKQETEKEIEENSPAGQDDVTGQTTLDGLRILKKSLIEKFGLKENKFKIDEKKIRILTSSAYAKLLSKKIQNKVAIVTEYPTWDEFLIEMDPLNY